MNRTVSRAAKIVTSEHYEIFRATQFTTRSHARISSRRLEPRTPFIWRSAMIFMLFAVAISALFFVGSLILLRLGQHLGLRHRKRSGTGVQYSD